MIDRATVRYLLVGASLFALDLAVFVALATGLGVPPAGAQAVSRTTGAVAGFFAHRRLTFRSRGPLAAQGSGYAAVAALNLLASPALVALLVSLLHGHVVAAKLVAEVLVVCESFLLLRLVFRGEAAPSEVA